MKIVQLLAENCKRLTAVQINPDKSIVMIGGKNGAGKSSVLDSISMALEGKAAMPEEPLRTGSKKGKIEIDLGDIKVIRTLGPGGATSLTVMNAEGAKYGSPQAILDALVGKLAFDPLAFLRMKSREQADLLRDLAGVDLVPIEKRRDETYTFRAEANAEVKRLKGAIESKVSYADAPKEPVSAATIMEKIKVASDQNNHNAATRSELAIMSGKGKDLSAKVVETKETIARLNRELTGAEAILETQNVNLAVLRKEYARKQVEADKLTDTDLSPFNSELEAVEATNSKVRANQEKAGLSEELRDAEKNAAELDQRIKDIDTEKAAMLKNSALPVEGLTFDEGTVYIDALPLNQASGAKQLRTSIAIATAMHPKLRVMICKDGALLDDDSLALLAEYADENDMQIWLESCQAGDKATVTIEDGQIKE